MNLSRSAKRFDKTVCADAYTPVSTFLAQLEPYDDSRRDGYSVVRRILSIAPGLAVPTRRVVAIGSDTYIVGLGVEDVHKNVVLRVKHVIHKTTGLASVFTIAGALGNAPQFTSYVAVSYVRGAKEADESSDLIDVVAIYTSSSESVLKSNIVQVAGAMYLVRNVHVSESGYLVADSDVLDTPNIETVTFESKVYNPVTSTYTSSSVSAKVLRLRWQSKFDYLGASSKPYLSGDDIVFVRKSDVTPKVGDAIPLSDGVRNVLSVTSEGDCWNMHVRRS